MLTSARGGEQKMPGTGESSFSPDAAKLAALAEFAAGAGHEINNPLATIAGRVQLLLQEETDPERRQALQTIGAQAYRIRDMIGDVMLFARPPQPTPALDDLSKIAAELHSKFTEEAAARNCLLSREAPTAVPVWGDPVQMLVASSALVQNSLDAARPNGRITIVAELVSHDGHPWARLSVEDDGPGLTELDRVHLFDPFYSGRQAGRGLGFGLSKCWRIVTNHRGRIEVASSPGNTRFDLYFPASPPSEAAVTEARL